jgi:hypothetical protein
MTTDHRRLDAESLQEALLDEPAFLREIVERVVQQILEAEMTESMWGPLPTNVARGAHRPPQRLQAEGFAHQGHHPQLARAPRPGGDLLHAAVLALPEKREGARAGAHGDVCGGSLHEEGQGDNRGAVRHLFLQEPRFLAGRLPRLGA